MYAFAIFLWWSFGIHFTPPITRNEDASKITAYPPAKAAQCVMLAIILLVLLAFGFYAFIGTSSKQASEMLLAGMWVVLGLLMLAGIVISLLR